MKTKFAFALVLVLYIAPMILGPSSMPTAIATDAILADGEAWYEDYQYRQNITITGTAGAGNNYQVRVELDLDDPQWEHNPIQGFDDIRFTDNDGETELAHWREVQSVISGTATFWVNVTDSLETSALIWMYYGKAGASSASDGDSTFFFFDDFENNNLDKWDTTSEASTQGTMVKYGSYAAYLDYASLGTKIEATSSFPTLTGNGYMIHAWLRTQSVTRGPVTIGFSDDGPTEAMFGPVLGYETTTSKLYTYNGSYVAWSATDDLVANTWYRTEWALDLANAKHTAYINRASRGEIFLVESDGTVPETLALDAYRLSGYSSVGYDVWIDDVYVRKWVSGDCSVSSFGAEQEYTPPPPPTGNWHELPDAFLWLDLLTANLNTGWFVLAGMVMVAGSGLYLVKGGRKEASMNKVFFFLVLFMLGWGLIIGGIAP